jgi:hypothetical protein
VISTSCSTAITAASPVDELEPEGDVDQHPAQRVQRRQHRLVPQLLADLRAHHLRAANAERGQRTLLLSTSIIAGVTPSTSFNWSKLVSPGPRRRVAERNHLRRQPLPLLIADADPSPLERLAQMLSQRLRRRVVEVEFAARISEVFVQRATISPRAS